MGLNSLLGGGVLAAGWHTIIQIIGGHVPIDEARGGDLVSLGMCGREGHVCTEETRGTESQRN